MSDQNRGDLSMAQATGNSSFGGPFMVPQSSRSNTQPGAGTGAALGASIARGAASISAPHGGGTAALDACTWQTTETRFIESLKELGRKAEQTTQEVTRGIQDARNTLENWKNSWWGKLIPGVFDFIDAVLSAIDAAVRIINEAIQLIVWVVPKIMAPWTIRSIGRLMQDPFVNKVNVFSESLTVSNLESQKSWHSPAGIEWRARAQEQYTEGGKPTVEATKKFADATTTLGDRAVAACEKLAGDLTGGLIDIIGTVRDLKKITKLLPGLLRGIGLAIQIITLIVNIIQFAAEVVDSANDFNNAVSGPAARRWPNAASI